MTLTKMQNEELDSLKNKIEIIESRIESAKNDLMLAIDCDDSKKKIGSIENAIDFGHMQIKNMLQIQSQSMKIEINLLLDLIFDREYTLSVINK